MKDKFRNSSMKDPIREKSQKSPKSKILEFLTKPDQIQSQNPRIFAFAKPISSQPNPEPLKIPKNLQKRPKMTKIGKIRQIWAKSKFLSRSDLKMHGPFAFVTRASASSDPRLTKLLKKGKNDEKSSKIGSNWPKWLKMKLFGHFAQKGLDGLPLC